MADRVLGGEITLDLGRGWVFEETKTKRQTFARSIRWSKDGGCRRFRQFHIRLDRVSKSITGGLEIVRNSADVMEIDS